MCCILVLTWSSCDAASTLDALGYRCLLTLTRATVRCAARWSIHDLLTVLWIVGRVRHESVRICVGPLLTIHVHNYESYEKTKRAAALTEAAKSQVRPN